jgi:ribosomal protein S18 acetylase RimI-like enzyme
MIDIAAIVRSACADDIQSIGEIADATGLFPADMLPGMITDHVGGSDVQVWRVVELSGKVAGFAFAEPERLTDRTWNLRAIGVAPARHRLGLATALLAGVETALRARAARVVVIETTNGEDQIPARAFYEERGYNEEARVREFWESGVDKVVFCKLL